MQCRCNGRRAPAPVVPCHCDLLEAEGIGKVDHILADCRLFGHARRGRIAESSGTVAAKIGHQHSIPGFRKRRRYAIVRVCVVGEAMQQNNRKTLRIAAFFVCDLKRGSLY